MLGPIFDAITAAKVQDNREVTLLRRLLERIPSTDVCLLAEVLADEHISAIDRSDPAQVTVCFRYPPRAVRLVQCFDLKVEDKKTYNASARAKRCAQLTEERVGEAEMPVAAQKYLMARILAERQDELSANVQRQTTTMTKSGGQTKSGAFDNLQSLAREQYWLDMTREQRAQAREAALQLDTNPNLEAIAAVIEANWKARWNNGRFGPDYFATIWPTRQRPRRFRPWSTKTFLSLPM